MRSRSDGPSARATRPGSSRALLSARGASSLDSGVLEVDRHAVQSGFVARATALRRHSAPARARRWGEYTERGPAGHRSDTWIGRTMDHSQFKANQTAAVYVADGLDASTQE